MTGKQSLPLQVFFDVERTGSMDRRRGDKIVYPTTEDGEVQRRDKIVYPTTEDGEVQRRDRPHAISYMENPSKKWKTWIIPAFVVANFVVFIATMAVNDCPKNSETPDKCVLKFLGRMSFQPLKQNPLLGSSSST